MCKAWQLTMLVSASTAPATVNMPAKAAKSKGQPRHGEADRPQSSPKSGRRSAHCFGASRAGVLATMYGMRESEQLDEIEMA
jgi:hypothetical protein